MDYSLLVVIGVMVAVFAHSAQLHRRSLQGRPSWKYRRVFSLALVGLLLLVTGLLGLDLSHSRGWFSGVVRTAGVLWSQTAIGLGLLLLAGLFARRIPPA